MRTWKIVAWPGKPKKITTRQFVSLDCERCGCEAECPVINAPPVIAAKGMGMIFDYIPKGGLGRSRPKMIQCRNCGRRYVR
jgi:hypothetical protein